MTTIKITNQDGGEVNLTGYDAHERNVSLRKLLREHVCEVTFTKVDGTVRTMPCTLKTDIVPPHVVVEGAEPKVLKVPKEENLSVWCTDANSWRSFVTAKVTAIKVLS